MELLLLPLCYDMLSGEGLKWSGVGATEWNEGGLTVYRIDGNLFIVLWVIAIFVFFYTLVYMPSEWFGWLGSGICIGISIAQTIDTIREKRYMKEFHNYRG